MTAELGPEVATPQHAATLPPRVWGLSAADAHDRYWATKHVAIIRPGSALPHKGPALFLLVDRHEAVLFETAPVLKRLNALKPRALRIRIQDTHPHPYAEVVESDGNGGFLAIRRVYRARTRLSAHVWLTPDRKVAAAWAQAPDRAAAREALRALVRRDRSGSISLKGDVFDLSTPKDATALVNALVSQWRSPHTLVEDIYQFAPGVWLHEDVDVPPGVRLIGPVWIGAGVVLTSGDVLIGPCTVPDAPGEHPPVGEVDWEALNVPEYRILPRIPRRRPGRVAKRLFDIGFSLLVLAMTLPLYPFIMAAIWIEDGWPPFFAHPRQTIFGRTFPCYKFRTMCRNAEQLKTRLVAANVCDGPQFFIQDDPRLLKVGRILRKFQLDELPQFWNVLLGHMSVVGPRPSPDKENQFCPAWREARLSVRPGITGLWQVRRTRAPATDFQEWIRYDLEYVQRASWRLDMWIIFQTIRRIVTG